MSKAQITFIEKPACTTCRKAKALLEKCGVELERRDLGRDRLTTEELDRLIGGRDYKLFLNSKNKLYRARKMKEKPPTRADTLKLMAKEPNLIRRPVVIRGERMVLGFDEEALKKLAR
jgi:Spx/MgsR family transcriptional regulator